VTLNGQQACGSRNSGQAGLKAIPG
jgi:hypothetical protein